MPRLNCEDCGLQEARHFRLKTRHWVCLMCLHAADLERYKSEMAKQSHKPKRCQPCRRGDHRACYGLITDYGDVRPCGCSHTRRPPQVVMSH